MGICDSVPVPKQRIRKVGRQSSEVQENRCRTSRRINEETEFKITKGILI